MNYTNYQPEGKTNPLNIIIVSIIILAKSLFFGWLYNLTFLIPIIYFNFLITIGFGFLIAISIQILAKFFKIRERRTRIFLVIFMLIFSYYSHWIAYILYTYNQEIPSFTEYISYLLYPKGFLSYLGEINKYGTWSFGLLRDAPVNGITLSLIWLAEALIIFFVAIRYTYNFPENPFSEKSNMWYPKFTLEYPFSSFYSKDNFIESLNNEGIDVLLNWEKGLAYKYAAVSIFYLPNENVQYLSVDNIFIERNNKSKKNVTPTVTTIKISNSEAKTIMDKFGYKKEFLLDF